jgi:hypothetical protein
MFLNSLSLLFIISIISVRTVSSYDDDDEKTKIELDANNFGTSSALERSVVLSHTHTRRRDSYIFRRLFTTRYDSHSYTYLFNQKFNINHHTKQFMHPGVDIVGISCRALTR